MLKNLYTIKELQEIYGWEPFKNANGVDRQISHAASRGANIIPIEKDGKVWKFKLLNNPEKAYSQKQLLKKYNMNEDINIHDLVTYMEKRGIVIKRLDFCKRPYFYEIIDDSIFNREWVNVSNQSDLQVCREGDVRNKRTLTIYNMYTREGYKMYRTPEGECGLVHRLVMKTFCPIDNDEELYVDHINGVRDDKRLENLRWATELENVICKSQNWDLLKDNFNRLLQKIGYDGMNKLLEEKLQEKNIF